jgi:hypothetical protein
MKFNGSSFADGVAAAHRYNMHSSPPGPIVSLDITTPYCPFQNTIIYGARGIGKYTQALLKIAPYSPTALKCERRVTVPNDKIKCVYKTSDVHCEVDMMLLGCNAKAIWADVFAHMTIVASLKKSPVYIILCKNFHAIHPEIMDIFYSYMQPLNVVGAQLRFILLAENIGFIPEDICSRCCVIPLARPSAEVYASMICANLHIALPNTAIATAAKERRINTCKELYWYAMPNTTAPPPDITTIVLKSIISVIDNALILPITEIREALYELLVYGQDIHEIVWSVFEHYISTKQLCLFNHPEFMPTLFAHLKYRNNNYREIFHLENITFLFANAIHHHNNLSA